MFVASERIAACHRLLLLLHDASFGYGAFGEPLLEPACMNGAARTSGASASSLMQRRCRGDPLDLQFASARAQARERLVARLVPDDQLAEQRVVEGRDVHSPRRAAYRSASPTPPGTVSAVTVPGDGHEVRAPRPPR